MKHRCIVLISFCVLILTFSSCRQGKSNFTLKGIISDQTLGGALEGAKVRFYGIAAGGGDETLIETVILGAGGEYSFTFPRDKIESYRLLATKELYFDINATIFFSELTVESDNERNFSTSAKSWAKLRFVRSSSNPEAAVRYTKQLGKQGCIECCPSSEQMISGVSDTSIYCINDGNTAYSYFYTLMNTPEVNQGVNSVTTVAFDTSEVLFTY